MLADRVFRISEDLAIMGAHLEVPTFTQGQAQLSQRDVEFSQ